MSGLAGIILAAGTSSRFGADNKLLFQYAGKAMVRHVAEAALATELDPVIVVTGHDAQGVRAALRGLDLEYAHNAQFADGQAGSLKTGIAAVPRQCAGAMVLLGDMPEVGAEIINQLLDAFTDETGIVVPVHNGARGNPVILGCEHFAGLGKVSGDKGARDLLAGENVCTVDVASDAIVRDFDTPDSLQVPK